MINDARDTFFSVKYVNELDGSLSFSSAIVRKMQ